MRSTKRFSLQQSVMRKNPLLDDVSESNFSFSHESRISETTAYSSAPYQIKLHDPGCLDSYGTRSESGVASSKHDF